MIQFSKPFISLKKEHYKEIEKIIDSGWVSIGEHVEQLEWAFKRMYNVKHAIACSSATQGLIIALKSCGWRNKRIAVPAFTWASTIYAIECNIGNTPIFCDITPDTWLIDLHYLDIKDYDAVISVDIFGNQSDIRTDKPIIYDAAHGFGLKKLGHRGIAEVVSFSFTKITTATEGGIILTNDNSVAETSYELRRLSARLEEINALIGLQSLHNYNKGHEIKLKLIENYKKWLDFEYTLQKIETETNHSVFSILLDSQNSRNSIVKGFKEHDIEWKVYYEPIIEGHPKTDYVFSHILSLPLHPLLTEAEQKEICRIANDSVKAGYTPGTNYLKNSGYLETYLRKEL